MTKLVQAARKLFLSSEMSQIIQVTSRKKFTIFFFEVLIDKLRGYFIKWRTCKTKPRLEMFGTNNGLLILLKA